MTNGINDTNTVKKTIAARLKAARENARLTRQELVDKVNQRDDRPIINNKVDELRVDRLKQWEYGVNPISLEWLPILCDALNCDVGYLFGEYEEKRREFADVCETIGISEAAVKRLNQINNYTHGPLGVRAKGYTIPLLDVLSEMVESEHFFELINEISFYLIYGGALPENAYKTDERELSVDEHERLYTWANDRGLEIVVRKDVCEMHLQSACDALKIIGKEILRKEITGGNGKKE